MKVPEGFSEKEVIGIVDNILSALASTFRFGYYEVEDLKQEGWIYALEALENYDLSYGYSLNYFLYGHIRKRFINFKRNKFSRNDSPCLVCPFYDPENRISHNQCGQFSDKDECEKWRSYQQRNERKRTLNESVGSDATSSTDFFEQDVGACLDNKIIIQKINNELDVGLRADFRRMVDGVSISKGRKQKVIDAVKTIVGSGNI